MPTTVTIPDRADGITLESAAGARVGPADP